MTINNYIKLILLISITMNAHAQRTTKTLINVLIIDGYSNHDWKQTTAVTKGILGESKLFEVTVTHAPATTNKDSLTLWDPDFSGYQVIIQNTNNIFNQNLRWPPKVEQKLERFVADGGGLYILHSANNAFPHWKAYDEMIGLAWRNKDTGYALKIDKDTKKIIAIPPGEGKNTSHGERFDAVIHILNRHEINKGYPKKWITPSMELYTYARGPAKNVTVLSYAFDEATQTNWPVEWVVKYGKGHIYNSSMGHLWKGEEYPISYRCIGFQTTLIRTVEWLAKHKVSYKVPKNFPGEIVSARSETDYPAKNP